MTYNKPEVTVLGDANVVIQGSKTTTGDGGNPQASAPVAFELED